MNFFVTMHAQTFKNTSTKMWRWTNIFDYGGNSPVRKTWELPLKTSLLGLTFGISENEDWSRGHWLLREPKTRRSGEPKAKIQICCCLVTKLCPTLLWSHGLLPARFLCPWDFPGKNSGMVSIAFSRRSSQPRGRTCVSWSVRRILYHWAPEKP